MVRSAAASANSSALAVAVVIRRDADAGSAVPMSSIGLPSMLVRRAAKPGCSSNSTALCSAAKSASVMVPTNSADIDRGSISIHGPLADRSADKQVIASLTNARCGRIVPKTRLCLARALLRSGRHGQASRARHPDQLMLRHTLRQNESGHASSGIGGTMGTTISFKRPDGKDASGYLAKPGRADAPGVVVIQEWWGLQDQIKGICDRFALAGYEALAPDLYAGTVVPYHDADAANREMS